MAWTANMSTFSERWALPLFTKELLELAGKRQTYTIRACYASGLSLATLVIWILLSPRSPGSVLELIRVGYAIGTWIYCLQAAGIQWLWPIMASSTLTAEKERNTLPLLFLTRLGPTTIIVEKFFSRLLVVASFHILSLPVMSLALSMGGLSPLNLLFLSLILMVQAIEITAISLMCSAYFRTTTGSLIGTYIVAVLVKFAISAIELVATPGGATSTLFSIVGNHLQLRLPNALSLRSLFNFDLYFWNQMLPSLLVSGICLLLARHFLVHRTFMSITETSLKAFVDRVGTWANRLNQNAITRGAILIREGRREPENDPVAWRETTTRALGQPRYLIGNFLALEFPIIWFLSIVVAKVSGAELYQAIGNMQMALWLGMLMMITTVISGMIIQERQKQTWETLLVTPLTNRDIVQQKMDGIQRMLWILQAPLWTCLAFRAYHEQTFAYVLNEASLLLLYPRIVAWLAMTQGMIYKNRIQASVMTLLSIGGLILIGVIFAGTLLFTTLFVYDEFDPSVRIHSFLAPLLLCPITLPICNLLPPAPNDPGGSFANAVRESIIPSVWNFAIFFIVLRLVKHRCFKLATKNLRKNTLARSHVM